MQQRAATFSDEEILAALRSQMGVPHFGVVSHRVDRGRMQGHETGLTKLCLTNRQNPLIEINVIATEVESFGMPKTREQAE